MLRPLQLNFRFAVCGKDDIQTYAKAGVTDVIAFSQIPHSISDVKDEYGAFSANVHAFIVHDAYCQHHKECGLILPDENLVKSIIVISESIIKKVRNDERVFVLFQCSAGISRSTSAAFIFLCMLLGPSKEWDAFEYVKAYRQQAHPNPLIVNMAQKFLNLNIRMTEALRHSGRRHKTDITF